MLFPILWGRLLFHVFAWYHGIWPSLPSFTEFFPSYRVQSKCFLVWPSFNLFLPGITGFDLVLPGFTELLVLSSCWCSRCVWRSTRRCAVSICCAPTASRTCATSTASVSSRIRPKWGRVSLAGVSLLFLWSFYGWSWFCFWAPTSSSWSVLTR